jgi:hypothetical protein
MSGPTVQAPYTSQDCAHMTNDPSVQKGGQAVYGELQWLLQCLLIARPTRGMCRGCLGREYRPARRASQAGENPRPHPRVAPISRTVSFRAGPAGSPRPQQQRIHTILRLRTDATRSLSAGTASTPSLTYELSASHTTETAARHAAAKVRIGFSNGSAVKTPRIRFPQH